jgi:hypothetical protein
MHLMEVVGTAAVVEMLLPESAELQSMRMVDESSRGIDHPVAVVAPAVTELAVFGRSQGEVRVKAAYRMEDLGRQGEVIGGEEGRLVGVGIVVGI